MKITTENKKRHGRLLMHLLSLMGSLGTVTLFMTAIRPFYRFNEPLIVLICFLSWAVFSVLFSSAKLKPPVTVVFLCAAGSLPLYSILNFSRFSAGISEFAKRFEPYVKSSKYPESSYVTGDANIALALITMLLTIAIIYSCTGRPKTWLAVLAAAPIAEVCLLFGLVPVWSSFASLIIFWGALAAAEYAGSESGSVQAAYRSAADTAFVLLTAVIIGFTAAKFHERSDFVKDLRTAVIDSNFSFEKLFTDLQIALFPAKDHKLTHDGKLGNVDKIEFEGSSILEVTIPADSGSVYLKGFTGAEYNGTDWSEYEFEPELMTNITSAEFIPMRILKEYDSFTDLDTKYIVVTNTPRSPRPRYYPNFAAGLIESDGTRRKYWGYFPEGSWQLRVILDAQFTQLSDTLAADEYTLRKAAYKDCMDIPPAFDCAADFLAGYESDGLIETLEFIRMRLASECEYSLESGKKPVGKDFAKWFLTENKKGSCTHFATAAVLLCRSVGIPARYCEGFIINPKDADKNSITEGGYITMTVPDNRAHAWAEIYVNGYGWMPFETTPGYGNVTVNLSGAFNTEGTSVMTEVETMPPESIEEPEVTTLEPAREETSGSTAEPADNVTEQTTEANAGGDSDTETESETGTSTDTETGGGGSTSPDEKHDNRTLSKILTVFGFIAVIALFISGIIIIRKRQYKNAEKQIETEPKKAVLTVYNRFAMLAGINAVDISEPHDETFKAVESIFEPEQAKTLISAAMQAKFGEDMSPDTARAAVNAYTSLMDRYCTEKNNKYLAVSFIRFIICDYRTEKR